MEDQDEVPLTTSHQISYYRINDNKNPCNYVAGILIYPMHFYKRPEIYIIFKCFYTFEVKLEDTFVRRKKYSSKLNHV